MVLLLFTRIRMPFSKCFVVEAYSLFRDHVIMKSLAVDEDRLALALEYEASLH